MNPYQLAITAVGNVLKDYDRDGVFPVFGYGARLKAADGKYNPVSHCFPIHPAGSKGCAGIDGVLEVY